MDKKLREELEFTLTEMYLDEGIDPEKLGSLITHREDAINQLRDLLQQSILATGIVLAGGIIAVGIATYYEYFSKNARKCKGYTGKPKEICMQKMKAVALSKELQVLNKSKGLCKKSKNPSQCVDKINKKASKLNLKISSLNERIRRMKAGVPNMPKI